MKIVEHKKKEQKLPEVLNALLPEKLIAAVLASGASCAEEIRLHAGRVCTVSCGKKNYDTGILLSQAELADLVSAMCRGSPYAYQRQICEGYLTLSGGVRVGICGTAVMEKDRLIGVNDISGLILRLPHTHPVSVTPILNILRDSTGLGGILIFSPPGIGKTTCLRAVAREASLPGNGWRTVVVDTREEFIGQLNESERLLDILVGYPHSMGIDIAVRTLGAELVICDEIGTDADANALLLAANRGVPVLASAHAASLPELLRRPCMQQLHRAGVFDTYIKLKRNARGGFDYEIHTKEEADGCS